MIGRKRAVTWISVKTANPGRRACPHVEEATQKGDKEIYRPDDAARNPGVWLGVLKSSTCFNLHDMICQALGVEGVGPRPSHRASASQASPVDAADRPVRLETRTASRAASAFGLHSTGVCVNCVHDSILDRP